MKRPYDPEGLRKLAEECGPYYVDQRTALNWAAELITPPEPDWSKAPSDAVAFAIDANGMGHYYREEPTRGGLIWDGDDECSPPLIRNCVRLAYDWKDTLSLRPSHEQSMADKYGLTPEQIQEIRNG